MNEPQIDDLVKKLTNFNIDLLAESRVAFCSTNSTSPLCVVVPNTYTNWVTYLNTEKGNTVVFSKGTDRLETWKALLYNPPFLYFGTGDYKPNETNKLDELKTLQTNNPDCYYFIVASLMIIFQVFGDGNHRTANEFYDKYTGKKITAKQYDKINEFLSSNDYSVLKGNPENVKDIIGELERYFTGTDTGVTGGMKKRKMTKQKRNTMLKSRRSLRRKRSALTKRRKSRQ